MIGKILTNAIPTYTFRLESTPYKWKKHYLQLFSILICCCCCCCLCQEYYILLRSLKWATNLILLAFFVHFELNRNSYAEFHSLEKLFKASNFFENVRHFFLEKLFPFLLHWMWYSYGDIIYRKMKNVFQIQMYALWVTFFIPERWW